MENRIIEKVAKLEAITDDHKEEINRLKDDNVLLHRLTVNQETLTELVKESQDVHKETRKTLSEINDNLHNMTITQEKMQLSQETMQGEITQMKGEISTTNSRIEEVEKNNEKENDKGKISVNEIGKKIIEYAILAIIATILYNIGLKP